MITETEIITKIRQLKNGESCHINLGEESGAEIWRKHNCYVLFEIPQYGGDPIYTFTIDVGWAQEIANKILSWS